MEKQPPNEKQEFALNLSPESIEFLTNRIEQKIIDEIKKDPKKFYPPQAPKDLVFYTTDEVAEALNVTPVTVRNMCKSNRIGFYRIGGTTFKISQAQLEEYLLSIKSDRNE